MIGLKIGGEKNSENGISSECDSNPGVSKGLVQQISFLDECQGSVIIETVGQAADT